MVIPRLGWLVPRRDRLPDVVEHPLRRGLYAASPREGSSYTAIADPPHRLLELARLAPGRRPRAEYAVLVLERPGQETLDETGRDRLWRAFETPIYRLLLGFDGTVLGHECETLTGLHATDDALFETHEGRLYVTSLTDGRRLKTGWQGRLATGPCHCARPGVRLVSAQAAELWNAAD